MRPLTWPYFDLILRTPRLANHLCLHTFKEVESKRGKFLAKRAELYITVTFQSILRKNFTAVDHSGIYFLEMPKELNQINTNCVMTKMQKLERKSLH